MTPQTTGADRWLIVNADDFGQSHAINRGVMAAFERGVVTSASLMVRWPASGDAAAYGREHRTLSMGLHVDFGEWAYRDEAWLPIYQVADTEDHGSCRLEVERQLGQFRALSGHDPTHLDSHQHVHAAEPLRSLLIDVAARLGIPLRNIDSRARYEGAFYGQSGRGYSVPEAIEVDSLLALLDSLPAGVTELGCHPGEIDEELETMYRAERAQEVRTLCDPRVRERIRSSGVRLCSFDDLAPGGRLARPGTRAR